MTKRPVWTIYKKELNATFQNPGVYAVAGLFFLLVSSLTIRGLMTYARESQTAWKSPEELIDFTQMMMSVTFGTVSILYIFVVPILTMRSFAEERRGGTWELLGAWPVGDWHIILGKFLSLSTILVLFEAFMGVYVAIFHILGTPDDGVVLSAFTGLFLLSLAYCSLGLFASSLTENQIIAAIITFAGLFLFAIIQNLSSTTSMLSAFFNSISITAHFTRFVEGGVFISDFVYFIVFTIFWLFMTARSLEARRLVQ